jgi:hypothetical protein
VIDIKILRKGINKFFNLRESHLEYLAGTITGRKNFEKRHGKDQYLEDRLTMEKVYSFLKRDPTPLDQI